VAVTLVAGLALSFALFQGVRRFEELQAQRDLDSMADSHVAAIRQELEKGFVTLQMLRAFHHSSREVERGEFHVFAASLFRNFPGIRAMAWIPRVPEAGREALETSARRDGLAAFRITETSDRGERVPAGDRGEYFPVFYMEPFVDDEPLRFPSLGLDIGSEASFRDDLARAGRSGEPVITSRFRLGPDAGGGLGFVQFLPVYRNGVVAGSLQERQESLEGFFLGLFHLGDLLETALDRLGAAGLDLLLQDLSAPEGERFLHGRRADGRAWDPGRPGMRANVPEAEEPGGRSFRVADRQWSFLFVPTPEFRAAHRTRQPFVVLFLGLFCTGVVAAFFALNAHGNARLAWINEELLREIRERRRAEGHLQDSEMRFRALFLNAPVGMGVAEIGGGAPMGNDAVLKMFGFTREDAPVADVSHYYCDPQERSRILEEVLSVGIVRNREVRMRRKDGTEFLARMTMIRFPFQGTQQVVSLVEDITEHKRSEEELRASEARFRAVFEGSLDAVLLADPADGRILDANPAASVLLGRSHEDIVGMPASELYPPKVREAAMDTFHRVARNRETLAPVETRVIRSDGTEIPVDVQAQTIRVAGLRVVYAVFHDITQRREAQRALQESEAAKRSILKAVPIGIGLVHGRVVSWVSERLNEMLGYSGDELLGKSTRILYESGQEYERVGRVKSAVILEQGIAEAETRWQRKDGRVIDVLLRFSAIDPQDLSRGVTFSVLDITERKEAEKTLRMLETAVAQTSDGVVVVDAGGRTLFCNPAWARMHGYTAEELVGTPLTVYLTGTQIEDILVPLRRQVVRHGWAVAEMNLSRKDGTEFSTLLRSDVIRDANGRSLGFVTIATDTTERRKWEEELAKVQRLQSLGVLAGGIAHDFNNILTAILSNLSMARIFGNPQEDISEMLSDAERATLRARGLTQQLLAFASGGAPVKKALSLPRVLKDTVTFSLSGSSVHCQYDLPDDLWPVEADEVQLGQVVQNLVINADQAMAEGGTLFVRAANVTQGEEAPGNLPPGRYVKITVEDQGSGIPENLLSKIFDPFFTTKEKGRGLGLATAFSIVNRHGGHLCVDSRVGVGTRMDIFLPAASSGPSPEVPHLGAPVRGGGRVLLIDDEETIRKATGEVLKRLGYEVVSAREGREGIDLYQEARSSGRGFHAVIMDLTIPGGMGGREAVKALLEIDPEARVVASSGYSDDPVMARHQEFGFRAAVNKPYQMEDLAEALRKALVLEATRPIPGS